MTLTRKINNVNWQSCDFPPQGSTVKKSFQTGGAWIKPLAYVHTHALKQHTCAVVFPPQGSPVRTSFQTLEEPRME
jgi:hypothetical protein